MTIKICLDNNQKTQLLKHKDLENLYPDQNLLFPYRGLVFPYRYLLPRHKILNPFKMKIEGNIIKNVKIFVRLKEDKIIDGNIIKNVKDLFRLKKQAMQLKMNYLGILKTFLKQKSKIALNQ